MNNLSVILITYNEEHNIEACLQSVSFASEIIIVDSTSTDRTVEIAKHFTENIFVREWMGYGEAKNFALDNATSDWILWIDADERVTEELTAEIQSLLQRKNIEETAFQVARRAYFLGKWIRHCGWYPGYVTRLFRKDSARFKELSVHETLEVLRGRTGVLTNDLLHYTDPNLFHYFEKFNRYTTLASEELVKQKKSFSLFDVTIRPFAMFVKMYFLKQGFLDGMQGFILSVCSSAYVFTKYAKLWEKRGRA